MAWILDARSTEFDIAAWKGHPLDEIKESALLIEKAGGAIAGGARKQLEKKLADIEGVQGVEVTDVRRTIG